MYYAYLNSGLTILFNGNKYKSQNGLKKKNKKLQGCLSTYSY